MALKDGNQLADLFNKATGDDSEQAARMVNHLKALDEAFGGDVEAVVGVLKLLAGYSMVLKLQVQRDAAMRDAADLNQQKQTLSQNTQTELNASLAELSLQVQAKQQAAQQYQAQIDAVNAQLPALLQ